MKIIRKLREIYNLSRNDLTESLNITIDAIDKYENGKKNPYFPVLVKIADFFQVSIDFLVNTEDTKSPRNLKLINLASEIDKRELNNIIIHISEIIKSFIKHDEKIIVQIDNFDIDLTDDFHKNLRIFRQYKDYSYEAYGKKINMKSGLIRSYEINRYPPAPKLVILANGLYISVHSLCTGEKLSWIFKNNDFFNLILKADHFCNLDEHRMLIYIMTKMLEN